MQDRGLEIVAFPFIEIFLNLNPHFGFHHRPSVRSTIEQTEEVHVH